MVQKMQCKCLFFAQKSCLDRKKPFPVNFLCYFTKNSDWISLHVKFVMYITSIINSMISRAI